MQHALEMHAQRQAWRNIHRKATALHVLLTEADKAPNVDRWSEGLKADIFGYIVELDFKPRETADETKAALMALPRFASGSFTYLQARTLADHLHAHAAPAR